MKILNKIREWNSKMGGFIYWAIIWVAWSTFLADSHLIVTNPFVWTMLTTMFWIASFSACRADNEIKFWKEISNDWKELAMDTGDVLIRARRVIATLEKNNKE